MRFAGISAGTFDDGRSEELDIRLRFREESVKPFAAVFSANISPDLIHS